MGLTKQVEINSLVCISPSQGIEICPIDMGSVGVTEFRIPSSHETNLVHIAPGAIEDLFMHHYQTDQLLVVRGQAVLVVLLNGKYQYILMSECEPKVIKIPPGIPHGAINPGSELCVAINSVIRHGPAYERDYRPLKRRIPYDMAAVQALVAEFRCPQPASVALGKF